MSNKNYYGALKAVLPVLGFALGISAPTIEQKPHYQNTQRELSE